MISSLIRFEWLSTERRGPAGPPPPTNMGLHEKPQETIRQDEPEHRPVSFASNANIGSPAEDHVAAPKKSLAF
ncbi:hypothetical protein CTA2_11727 [Colletotrichum tanaceti]|uniref:Uncharacterized protein n=1 Tax=Colletotrichum tanaceti TaxID=1306861 RepID=A0A4U6X2H1_9PEZI|nr:hypothetical protein CTA2_11727 [Colletotrichum tanaceti]TKW49345.1 hypothetical protein CTA1_9025 [Colletotrichum tanaceti]